MERNNNSLVPMGKIKDSLLELFSRDTCLNRLIKPENYYDTPVFAGTIAATDTCLCLDTQITYAKASVLDLSLCICIYAGNQALRLSEEDKHYFTENYGFAGNRTDMALMAIHRLLTDPDVTRSYGIGCIQLSEEKNPISFILSNEQFFGKTMNYHIFIPNKTPKPTGRVML